MADVEARTIMHMPTLDWRSPIGRSPDRAGPSTGICCARQALPIADKVAPSPHPGFARDPGGAGAIEFAIVAPLFLLILLGLLVYGIYLGSVHSVEQLAARTHELLYPT